MEGREDHRQARQELNRKHGAYLRGQDRFVGPASLSLTFLDLHNNLSLFSLLLPLLLVPHPHASLPPPSGPPGKKKDLSPMEDAQNPEQTHIPIAAFPSKPDITADDSLRRRRSRDQPAATPRKKTKTIKEEDISDDEKEEEDREEIEKKIEALQRIVPGGESLGMDKLFDETAGYIMALQYQIKGLRALSSLFERLEKDKSKLGG